jgi:hypothetical protein
MVQRILARLPRGGDGSDPGDSQFPIVGGIERP